MDLAPGSLVAGRYRLERRLGEGGMGVVWAARGDSDRRLVALKFLKAATHEAVQRVFREARLLAAIGHPSVVAVHEVIQLEDGAPVMVMEMLSGETLRERLARDGRLELAELCRVLVPVLSALGAAHALGVVHRDLKPDNIFLGKAPSGGLDVRVLDFGIAKLAGDPLLARGSGALTCTGAMPGTPAYMAPEQVFGERDIDHRADVWALGVIAYEALAGRRPTGGTSLGDVFRAITSGPFARLEDVAPGVPCEIGALVDRMLSRDRRPTDVREPLALLARHAGAARSAAAGSARAACRDSPKIRATWSRRLLIAVAVTAPSMVAVIGTGALGLGGRARPTLARAVLASACIVVPISVSVAPVPIATATPVVLPSSAPRRPLARPAPAAPAPASSETAAEPRLPGGIHGDSPY